MRLILTRVGTVAALIAIVGLAALPATAQVPQTITVDGTNDFDPANLIDADGGDTEIKNWCTDDPEDDAPMDLGNIYITNDTNNLYIGFEYDRECFASPQVNLGIAFSYGAEGDGSTTDPFDRKIAWNTITRKPDNVFYVVVDGFNFEALYEWDGATWNNIGSTINPSYGSGSNGLGMVNDVGFEELSLPLDAFQANAENGLVPGENLFVEIWMTQDGTSKPPLDAGASDDVQTSTTSATTFDVGTAVEMSSYYSYVVQDATDDVPPTVSNIKVDPFDPLAVEVTFTEPVDDLSATNAANYDINGAGFPNVASVSAVTTSRVRLTLDSSFTGSESLPVLAVGPVEDLAGNVIDPQADQFEFAVKEVTFRGLFENFLQNNSTGTDAFAVKGSVPPLDFTLANPEPAMTQVDAVNEIWEADVLFSWFVGPVGGAQTDTFVIEWKFAYNATVWESVGNRILTLDKTDTANVLTEHFWDDLDPSQFTDQDIDVIFTVDMSSEGPVGGDIVEIGGNVPPLSFSSPYIAMVDDGSGQDEVAGDDIYTVVITFPAGSLKNVEYKYLFNSEFECTGAGNRNVFLNDEVFDTIGGALGPLVMPLQTFDRCNVIAGDLEVVFSVDLANSIYDTFKKVPTVGLVGNVLPLVFDPVSSAQPMVDDGTGFDAVAGDLTFTTSVVFPDSSNQNLEYKYVIDGEFEGQSLPNRTVFLDDSFDATGNPLVLPLDDVHLTVPVGVGDVPNRERALRIEAYPNPFNPQTTIRFESFQSGRVHMAIFDARGRQVRTLVDETMVAGSRSRVWDGRGDDGRAVGSGVYFVRVLTPGAAAAAKLVLVK